MVPWKGTHVLKWKFNFQASIFSWYVSFQGWPPMLLQVQLQYGALRFTKGAFQRMKRTNSNAADGHCPWGRLVSGDGIKGLTRLPCFKGMRTMGKDWGFNQPSTRGDDRWWTVSLQNSRFKGYRFVVGRLDFHIGRVIWINDLTKSLNSGKLTWQQKMHLILRMIEKLFVISIAISY